MEYVFGTEENILKTKADQHTSLTGYNELITEYPDQTVTDRFRVIKKIKSGEDRAGNCYDWYEIAEHYQTTNKFPSDICATEIEITDLEIENIELGQALTEAEIAIAELQEIIKP